MLLMWPKWAFRWLKSVEQMVCVLFPVYAIILEDISSFSPIRNRSSSPIQTKGLIFIVVLHNHPAIFIRVMCWAFLFDIIRRPEFLYIAFIMCMYVLSEKFDSFC